MTRPALIPALAVAAILATAGMGPVGARASTPSSGPAASGFRIPPPTKTVLKNGLTVLALERRSIPLVQFQLMVRSGAAHDPAGKEGTAALVARLLKRGTKSRSATQFFEEVEFVGGTIDTSATADASFVRGEFASRDVEVGFNLIADLAQNPAFRPEEFDKEKRLALAEIVDRLDDPGEVARLAFTSWLYGGHPYGHPVDGTQRSVQAITRDEVVRFYEARYVPNDAVLAVVGDIDTAQIGQRAERYFSGWKRRSLSEAKIGEPPSVRGRRVLLVDKPDATQSQIRFGNVGMRRADPEYFPMAVGNAVLGGGFTSWLTDEVRVKRGLTYGISSRLEALKSSGSFSIATFSKNDSVMETIKVSLEQVRRLRDGDLPADDLDKARNFLAGLYPLRIESPDDLTREILSVNLFGLDPDSINQYQKRVRAVSADAVKRAARRLPLDDLAVVVVGPAQSLTKQLETLGPLTVRPLDSALEGDAGAATAR